jgi:carbamoyl-phosphate synthase large subunit
MKSAKRVFVTGGAGVIGKELIPRLLTRGATVLVGDLKPRPLCFPPEVQYRQGDLNDMSVSELKTFRPEIVFHLAATFERTAETISFWSENFQHNVRLSHHIMTLAQSSPSVERVVFASSYLVYDPAQYLFDAPTGQPVGLTEGSAIRPRNLIGMAKLAHEMELEFLSSFREITFSSASVRIFRGFGRGSRDVISRWIRSLLIGERITVFRPEGLFDYIYAADSAEGLLRIAEADSIVGPVNLGTGKAHRVADVIEILRQHFPSMPTVEQDSDIPFEASEARLERLTEHAHWRPKYLLPDAIAEIIRYERDSA